MVDQVFDSVGFESASQEAHDSVSDQDALEIDLFGFEGVVDVDKGGQIGNVLACVRFSCNPEDVIRVFRVFDEEVEQGIEIVHQSAGIIIGVT